MMRDIRPDCTVVVGNSRGEDQRHNIQSAVSISDLAIVP